VVVVAASLMSLAIVEYASRTPVEFIVICSRGRDFQGTEMFSASTMFPGNAQL
jgi:hypothetical protein